MSVDDLLSDLATMGWLMNNCYQTVGHVWRVSLRRPVADGDFFSDWAEGETLEEALTECMSKLLDAEFIEDAPISTIAEAPRDLVAVLGIKRPSIPIKRRF